MRNVLPNRRMGETFDLDHVMMAGSVFSFHATVGYHPDGKIGEVFLNAKKLSTDNDVAARDVAILISFALQHGVPFEALQSAVTRDQNGTPQGLAGSLLDALAERTTYA